MSGGVGQKGWRAMGGSDTEARSEVTAGALCGRARPRDGDRGGVRIGSRGALW